MKRLAFFLLAEQVPLESRPAAAVALRLLLESRLSLAGKGETFFIVGGSLCVYSDTSGTSSIGLSASALSVGKSSSGNDEVAVLDDGNLFLYGQGFVT
jgi:hypothetical protein